MTAESPFLCMTADEYELWRTPISASSVPKYPCGQCPASWSRERKAEGKCNRFVSRSGGRPRTYHTADARLEAKRRHDRESYQRRKARLSGTSGMQYLQTTGTAPTMQLHAAK